MPFQVSRLSKNERLKLPQKNSLLSITAALNKFEINFIKFVLIIILYFVNTWKFILNN